MKKIAVVLFNLGGPDQPDSVQPFLFNLFNDKAIIGAPQPIRWMIAKLISTRRAPFAKEIYKHLGGKSPLLDLTQAQANALENALNDEADNNEEYRCFISMRYWHPMSAECVSEVKEWGADKAILLPLYPQFSTTTTGSSFKDWHKSAESAGLDLPTASIGCYPFQPSFIRSHAELLRKSLKDAERQKMPAPRILFSAHGLPQKIVDSGDPYQWQVEQTAKAVMDELSVILHEEGTTTLEDDHYANEHVICYQSKVGPLKWLEPSTEHEIERAAKENKPLIIVPIAFVSEHSETLVELDIEYREMAEEWGLKDYLRVPALGVQEHYLEALVEMCRNAKSGELTSDQKMRLCPPEFTHCPCRDAMLS